MRILILILQRLEAFWNRKRDLEITLKGLIPNKYYDQNKSNLDLD